MKKLKSGDGLITKKINWEFYNALQFMFQHTSKSETIDSMGTMTATIDDESHDDDDVGEAVNTGNANYKNAENSVDHSQELASQPQSQLNVPTPSCSQEPYHSQPRSLKIKRGKTNQPNSVDAQEEAGIARCLQVLNGSKQVKDEYSVFGEHVSNELRLQKDEEDIQFTLKSTILKAILEAKTAAHAARQYKKRSSASTTPLLSPSSSDRSSLLVENLQPDASVSYNDELYGHAPTYTVLQSEMNFTTNNN